MNWSKAFRIGCGIVIALPVVCVIAAIVLILLTPGGSVGDNLLARTKVPLQEVMTTPDNISTLTGVGFGAIVLDSACKTKSQFDERMVYAHFKTKPTKRFWRRLSGAVKKDPVHWRYDLHDHGGTYTFACAWGFSGLQRPKGMKAARSAIRIELDEGEDHFMIFEGDESTLDARTASDFMLPFSFDHDSLRKYFGYGIPSFRLVNYARELYINTPSWGHRRCHVVRFNSVAALDKLRSRLERDVGKNRSRLTVKQERIYEMQAWNSRGHCCRIEIPKRGNYAWLTLEETD